MTPVELFEALYTTRAMRRVSDQPVGEEVAAAMLDAAIRSPSGGNSQNWRFLVITDPEVRAQLGPVYRSAHDQLLSTVYAGRWEEAKRAGDERTMQLMRSSRWLSDNFEQVPMWLMAFCRNDPSGASIYPAVWSAMLAARAHAVGTCLTTILGMFESAATFEVLGVPVDRGWVLSAAVSCGHPLGRWGLANRRPVEEVSYSDTWGQPLTFAVHGPRWSPET